MTPGAFHNKLRQTAELIQKSHKIILACHMNPDGDAIGSMLGLGLGLLKMKKSVVMLCSDPVPDRYKSLPASQRIKREYHDTADLAVSVDCGSITQLSRLEQAFEKSKRIVEIDHHAYRTRFGDIQLVDRNVCSVGEIIFLLLQEMGVRIDKKIAECLLISALIETSSFSRQDIKTSTFDFCSKLMQLGVDFSEVSERYYWRKKLSAFQLSGLCFTRIAVRAKNKLAWSIIYKKDFEKFKGHQEDVDSVADDMMIVEDVVISILFREIEDNMLRVSLRSKEGINVGPLATIYGGGGHRDVAGCRIHNNEKTIERFIDQACQLIYRNKRHSNPR